MCESLPDISFGDAELFASAKVRSNLRAVNDVFWLGKQAMFGHDAPMYLRSMTATRCPR
jgi:hypothetical protein